MGWFDKLAWFRFLGVRTSWEMVRFALLRDWQETIRGPRDRDKHYQSPGNLGRVRAVQGGLEAEFENSVLRLATLRPGAVRVEWETGSPLFAYPSLMPDRNYDPPRIEQTDDGYGLMFPGLKVEITSDGALTFLGTRGQILRREESPLLIHSGWRTRAALADDASVFGLGERAAPLNIRGGSYRMWNRDPDGEYGPGDDPIYICIPTYLCLKSPGAYLIHYENSHDGSMHFNDFVTAELTGGGLVYAFIAGDLENIYRTYTDLIGRPPLPPRWALGYHQSRFSYMSSEEVRAIADQFKRHDLPLSAIHLDIDAMHGYRVFTFDPNRFGDIDALSAGMEAAGVHLVTIIDPGVKRDAGYERYDDGVTNNVFLKRPDGELLIAPVWPGASVFPDFSDPHARSWWGRGFQKMLDHGISGFWHDMNEPAAFAAWGANTLPCTTPHAMEGRGGTHFEAHNLYGLLMNHAAFKALREIEPGRRPWMLTRSGWAGIQKFAWTWTGDTESSWEVLRQTIPTVLGLGLTGIPYCGPDIGGFTGSPSAELYLRWFQLASFLPFFRTHSSNSSPRREPWEFGEPTLSHISVRHSNCGSA
ncbi:MAG: glycoside hydrolase family 31 protein [Anaerolineales bacterium]|nr:glycoside hydrolase family 31 protein [Anaerolineales bacterium]